MIISNLCSAFCSALYSFISVFSEHLFLPCMEICTLFCRLQLRMSHFLLPLASFITVLLTCCSILSVILSLITNSIYRIYTLSSNSPTSYLIPQASSTYLSDLSNFSTTPIFQPISLVFS